MTPSGSRSTGSDLAPHSQWRDRAGLGPQPPAVTGFPWAASVQITGYFSAITFFRTPDAATCMMRRCSP